MAPRTRTATLAATVLAVVVAGVVAAAPAQARGRPWPGHPDRVLIVHEVRPGDTATGLAVHYHAWTRELVMLNHLGPAATMHVGERIRIPVVVSRARGRDRTRQAATTPHTTPHTSPHTTASPRVPRHIHWRHWQMSRAEVRRAIAREARLRGVPPRLAQAVAWQESGWHQPVRSSAGALGVMQVLPATGLWMSLYTHRPLDLRDTHDNITAGVTLLRVLLDETSTTRRAVAAYYQGLGAVRRYGLLPETRPYVRNVLAIRDRL
jgi:soluble lytic murein transglycosylase-like protein